MIKTVSLFTFGLAAVLATAPATAQSVASARATTEQAPFVLHLEGLTAANATKLQADFAKLPTVATVNVDAAAGTIALTTAAGAQLDSDAAHAAVKANGLTAKSLDIPAWAAETVWVVQVSGGS